MTKDRRSLQKQDHLTGPLVILTYENLYAVAR